MTHVGNTECFALHFPESRPQQDAAFCLAVSLQLKRVATIGHQDGRDSIRTLARLRYVELECLSFLPNRNSAANGLRQQTMTMKNVVKLFFE